MVNLGSQIAQTTKTSFGLLYLIKKYWYWITLLVILVPAIFSAVKISAETNNPSYPFILLGLKIANADAFIYKDVQTLKTNPAELIKMEKPTEGIFRKMKYYWFFFLHVIWNIASNIYLIFFPLTLFYKLMSLRDTSAKMKNFFLSFLIFVIYLFIINMVIVVHGVVQGNELVKIPENVDFFEELWIIIKYSAPFKGLFALIMYLIAYSSTKFGG